MDRAKLYKQTFSNNLNTTSPPEIKGASGKSYTKITFYPDLQRFGMTEFDKDTVALLTKRYVNVCLFRIFEKREEKEN